MVDSAVVRRLSILLLLALSTLPSCEAPQGEGEARAWERFDLWANKPEVEVAAPHARRSWIRRIAYYGSSEVRDREKVPPGHFKRVKQLPASEIRALEQVLGSRLRWSLDVGEEAFFSFIPLRDERLRLPVEYRVFIRRDGGDETLLASVPAPTLVPPGQATEYVDLSAYAGESVELILELEPPVTKRDLIGRGRGMWGSPAVTGLHTRAEAPAGSVQRPNVLLIGADTLRADALGAYGADPSVTPALDRLAAQSDVWLEAVSCFNVTNPSFLSLMTGLYGKNHGIYNLTTKLAEEHETLAEVFSKAGYGTLAVISARHLGPQASGIGQGFDRVLRSDRHYTAELAVDMTMDWIARQQRPFFAWLHLFDPHTPHTPPAPFAYGFRPDDASGMRPPQRWALFRNPGMPPYVHRGLGGQKDLYASEIAYMDRQMDRLLDFLESRGLLETTILVFVADHGENLEDHGILYGHHGLFETTTRVPLMIRWPGPRQQGRRLEGLVQNVDIYPTLLKAVGLDFAEGDGRDLLEITGEGRRGRRVAFSEHAHQTGVRVRTDDFAYVRSQGNPFVEDGTYLYDLRSDPEESTNLAGTDHPHEAEMKRLLDGWLADRREAAPVRPSEMTEEDVDRLRALGYL